MTPPSAPAQEQVGGGRLDASLLVGRVRSLDGLRGLLALLVVVYHVELLLTDGDHLRGGWVGVDGFFVLSGFLITSLLVDEQRRTGTIAYARFVARRMLRIWPAMLVVVVVCVVPARKVTWHGWQHILESSALGGLFLMNWYQVFGVTESVWLGHLWTLAVEMHFYLTVPLVLLALQRLRVPRWGWLVVFVALAAGSAAWRRAVWLAEPGTADGFLLTHLRADPFLVGVVVALLLAWGWVDDRTRRPLRVGAAAGLLFLVWVVSDRAYLDPWLFAEGGISSVALAFGAVVTALVVEPHGLLARAIGATPVAAVGRRSYSLYLWHLPVIIFAVYRLDDWSLPAQLAVVVPLIAILTEASYRFVEKPTMALARRRFGRPVPGGTPVERRSEPTADVVFAEPLCEPIAPPSATERE